MGTDIETITFDDDEDDGGTPLTGDALQPFLEGLSAFVHVRQYGSALIGFHFNGEFVVYYTDETYGEDDIRQNMAGRRYGSFPEATTAINRHDDAKLVTRRKKINLPVIVNVQGEQRYVQTTFTGLHASHGTWLFKGWKVPRYSGVGLRVFPQSEVIGTLLAERQALMQKVDDLDKLLSKMDFRHYTGSSDVSTPDRYERTLDTILSRHEAALEAIAEYEAGEPVDTEARPF